MRVFQVKNLPMTLTEAVKVGRQVSRLRTVTDGGLELSEFGERWIRKHLLW